MIHGPAYFVNLTEEEYDIIKSTRPELLSLFVESKDTHTFYTMSASDYNELFTTVDLIEDEDEYLE